MSAEGSNVVPFKKLDMVGEYVADYSPLTPEQIAVDNAELLELYRNSTLRWPGGIDDLEWD